MSELFDADQIFNLNMTIQKFPFMHSGYRVYHAWLINEQWYSVEFTDGEGRILRGMVDKHREWLYLDAPSIMSLMDAKILEHLDAFNSGQH